MSFCPSCGTPTTSSTPPVKTVEQPVAPKKKSQAKTLGLLIIVLVIGAMLGAAGSTHSGATTTTETTTYTLPVMVTAEANVTEYKTAMSAIFSEFHNITTQTADNFRAFSNGQMSQTDLISFVSQQKDNLKVLMESALRLRPPSAFAEAHVHIVNALSLCYSAFTLYEDGLIQNNPSLITEGNAFVNQATNEFNTATSILNSTS